MRDVYKEWEKDGRLESILLLVKKWREDGAGLDEIADKLGISRTTLFKYQKEHLDFSDALKRGKEILDAEVENSLKKECIGYYYEETLTTTTAIVDTKTGQITDLKKVETKTNKKYARPSVTAIAYYLNNRMPTMWKNRVVMATEESISDETVKEMEKYFASKEAEQIGNTGSAVVESS